MTKRVRLIAIACGVVVGLGLGVSCQPAAPAPADEPERTAKAEVPTPTTVPIPPADLKAVVEGNNAFAADLFRELCENSDGNVLCSPYSIAAALSMTSAGARGETAAEMAKVLHVAGLGERVHPAHAALARELTGGRKDGPEIHIANALWGQRGLAFRPAFLKQTRDGYGAGLREVDFAGNVDQARRTINGWVGEQTKDKIPELLKPADLSPASKLVLTNAIYFKADWARQFNQEDTKDGPFHVSASESVTVPLMHQTIYFHYAETDAFQVVELPYVGRKYAMLIVLPTRPEDMARLQASLTGKALKEWLTHGGRREVELTLPRFTARSVVDLVPVLKRLGMRSAFGPGGDFSGLTGSAGLRVNAVVHEAWVEVDEHGTEAAAASAVPMTVSQPPPKVVCRADRPFCWVLWHRASGATLFVGRVSDPSR